MGLTITRRVNEELLLTIDPDMDPADLARQLRVGVRLTVANVENGRVRLRIFAPWAVKVTRPERFSPEEFERREKPRSGLWARIVGRLCRKSDS